MKWVELNSEWAILFLFPFSCTNKRKNNIALMYQIKKKNIPSELKSTHCFFEKLMKVANEKNVCHISLLNCLSLWENFLDDPPPNFHSWFWQKIDCSAPILHFWFGPKVNCAQYCVNLERDFRQFFAVMRDYWSFGNHQTASPPARSNCCWKMCLFSWCTYYSQKYSHLEYGNIGCGVFNGRV